MSGAKKFWAFWMRFCTVLFTLALIGGVGFYTWLWFATNGFHPVSDIAEDCITGGGTWNEDLNQCVQTS